MKTFIVLCFSLCLVEGSEGMSCFVLCFLSCSVLCFSLIQFCMLEVLCYAFSTCSKDRTAYLRHSASFGRRSDLKSIQPYFVISNVSNDDKPGLVLLYTTQKIVDLSVDCLTCVQRNFVLLFTFIFILLVLILLCHNQCLISKVQSAFFNVSSVITCIGVQFPQRRRKYDLGLGRKKTKGTQL